MRSSTTIVVWLSISIAGAAGADGLCDRAAEGLRRAARFFQDEISANGGYLWRYSEDLRYREGEGAVDATVGWIQPPGTPAVGSAFLSAYLATHDPYYLDAAKRVADALVRGQLRSGGWDNQIEFDPERRQRYAYRVDPPAKNQRNTTTLDDDKTQSAIRFLIRLDREIEFADPSIHEAVGYALDSLLAAQYPNGAWPQRFTGPADPASGAPRRASIPTDWPRTFPNLDYKGHYTLNDDTLSDVVGVMLEAATVYDDSRFRASAVRAGEFLIGAQLPPPQPGWAQQYDANMQPAWARKFEPPAVTGSESAGALKTLMALYRATGEQRFLEPIPAALDYYERSRLPDGRLARFYELGTNRPLYFTKEYELTYRDDDLPTHYGFQVGDWTERVRREYESIRKLAPAAGAPSKTWADRFRRKENSRASKSLIEKSEAVLAALDPAGRWVEEGSLRYQETGTGRIISCATFVKNIEVLSEYLATCYE